MAKTAYAPLERPQRGASVTVGAYSRHTPSPRYRDLLALYRRMHLEGEQNLDIPAEDTFAGRSVIRHASNIRQLIAETGASTLLDYGSGKGIQYERQDFRLPDGERISNLAAYWGVAEIVKYDPGYEPFAQLPNQTFDGVICSDVLEHCPEEDIPWIVDEVFLFAQRFVFANIASFPAMKLLPNGENAHCSVKSAEWWAGLLHAIAARHPDIRYRALIDTKVAYWTLLGGRRRKVKTMAVLDNGLG